MENSPPDCFVAFLKIILEIQAHADQWKSKLFYIEPNQIIALLTGKKEESQNIKEAPENIRLAQVNQWYDSRRKQKQQPFTQQAQKVFAKYFGFDDNQECDRQQFFRKLHPTNNKIILSIERTSITAQQCLNGFLNSILSGFDRLKPFRHRCLSQLTSIKLYFCQHLSMSLQHNLTKELLKEFMYEANLYGRINFMYIKQYLFGDKVEEIQWERLFGGVKKVQKLPEIVLEVSEENIMSEQAIKEDLSKFKMDCDAWKEEQNEIDVMKQKQEENGLESRITKQHMNNLTLEIYSSIQQSKSQSQSLILQTVSQIKTPSQSIARIQLLTPQQKSNDYSKVLSEIDHIESLLSKTKERYQKNREQLQNQTKMIRSSSLKRREDFGKLTMNSTKANDKYQSLKISEKRQQVGVKKPEFKTQENVNGKGSDQKAKSQLSKIKHSYVITDIRNMEAQPSTPLKFAINPNQVMTQSHVKPFITRQAMRKEISSILEPLKGQMKQPQQYNVPQRRQAGKIKRRSVSKDVKEAQKSQTRPNDLKFNNRQILQQKRSNYSEYEAVLKEIKKQENQYRRLVEERQKAIYERETRQKLTLTTPNQYKRYTPINQSFARTEQLQTPKYQINHHQSHFESQNYSQIVPSNNLSRSRISSKKRQEIVHRATSEARLRIQQIENRALKRLAKIDTEICQKPRLEKFNLQIQQGNPTLKQTKKQNIPTVAVKKHQNSEKKSNLFINDLLNERPALRLTYTTSKTNKL